MKLARLGSLNMRYAVRFALLIVAVCALDCAVVLSVTKPLPWAAMIPGLIPLLMVPLVIIPMQRAKKNG